MSLYIIFYFNKMKRDEAIGVFFLKKINDSLFRNRLPVGFFFIREKTNKKKKKKEEYY